MSPAAPVPVAPHSFRRDRRQRLLTRRLCTSAAAYLRRACFPGAKLAAVVLACLMASTTCTSFVGALCRQVASDARWRVRRSAAAAAAAPADANSTARAPVTATVQFRPLGPRLESLIKDVALLRAAAEKQGQVAPGDGSVGLEFELSSLEASVQEAKAASARSADPLLKAFALMPGWNATATLAAARAERARYDELVKELQSSTERLEEARIRRQEAVAKLKALEERAGKLDGAVKEVGDAVGVGGVFGLMNYFMSEDARIDQTIQKVSALKNRATQ
eukprot:TRINITY_DN29849_c0_g1_i1.p1 TRINITY_DN29849_c0_g1~~TRINITY_DN29849_c0_g1_i1.p1  ORF type:complete len:300 (+),score=71.91 TRINITY_DN29849_c0_g1_i1:68-901(+)